MLAFKLGYRRNVVQGVPFRSVPTPVLPGANSHWISGESRGGEQTQTAPLSKCHTKKELFRIKYIKIQANVAQDAQRDTQNQKPQMAGNAWFHYNTLFSCILFFLGVHMPVAPKRTGTPNKKPDFYDTCDAGVLIGKLPCTSTLAQSVANIPGHRKGRPRVMYHMNCLFMCHAVVNNAAQIYSRILFTRVSRELP